MSSAGMVTIKKDGVVLMKIITESAGYNARPFAIQLARLRRVPTVLEASQAALAANFGNARQHVVITENASLFAEGDPPGLGPKYRQMFQHSSYNPRCGVGVADFLAVIDLPGMDGEREFSLVEVVEEDDYTPRRKRKKIEV